MRSGTLLSLIAAKLPVRHSPLIVMLKQPFCLSIIVNSICAHDKVLCGMFYKVISFLMLFIDLYCSMEQMELRAVFAFAHILSILVLRIAVSTTEECLFLLSLILLKLKKSSRVLYLHMLK